ncbi:DUF1254 domain-containing protein [Pseudomonas sp. IPO3749]|uniref:DUF1254 domain-containing protein n=1 Tax=Pseudomonas fluorescens LMG 5329 TaxID=1324332 RepID=A0A0A1Z086_PSEFL|nr:hypothetical protein K814_0112430 [Pseudomonas fluorescens LMG 5329]NWE04815.1 DUF1254 domain-containing protein [Pseudomonas sp. IPO3749]NWF24550.1 DUF1254 domain-containing protein [Pseudomonas sp. IPO3749]
MLDQSAGLGCYGRLGAAIDFEFAVYGQTFLDLSKEPVVFQLLDIGTRSWVLHCMDDYSVCAIDSGT